MGVLDNFTLDNFVLDGERPLTVNAGDKLIYSNLNTKQIFSTSYAKHREVKINFNGKCRVTFGLQNDTGSTAYGKVYINGKPVGIERAVSDSSDFWTQDFQIKNGDYLQIYCKYEGTNQSSLSSWYIYADYAMCEAIL